MSDVDNESNKRLVSWYKTLLKSLDMEMYIFILPNKYAKYMRT